jgi:DNA helicase-2/ATP-dependent DNA helicase PcrA
MAIFYRIHAQSRVFEEALRAANVAYQVIGGVRFYDRAEVKDLLAYLRVVTNVDDDVSLLRIVNVPARGIGKTSLDKVMEIAARHGASVWSAMHEAVRTHALGATSKRLGQFLALVERLRQQASTGEGPAGLARAVLAETQYENALKDDDTPEADARLENLRELLGSMEEFEQEAETPTLSAFLELVTLQTSADESGPGDKLTLMTVHAAKGLEFPVVLVAGLEEQMFPYRGLDADDDPEELEEERRLAYVAFTRAREKLILAWAPMRRVFGQPRLNPRSRFLDELPRDDIRDIATATPRSPSYGGGGLSWGSTGHGSSKYGASAWGSPPSDDARPWSHPQAGRDARAHSAPAARSSGASSRQTTFAVPSFGEHGGRGASPAAEARGGSYVDRSEADAHADEGVSFRIGMAVAHAKYGVGKVQALSGGMPPKVTVAFPGWGVKQIVASFLEPA